jgi:hypothetical protein
MKDAIATRTFRRSDTKAIVHAGRPFSGEDAYVDQLVRNRLARVVSAAKAAPENKADPSPAASRSSSASPVAQVSPKTTAKKSGDGGTPGSNPPAPKGQKPKPPPNPPKASAEE